MDKINGKSAFFVANLFDRVILMAETYLDYTDCKQTNANHPHGVCIVHDLAIVHRADTNVREATSCFRWRRILAAAGERWK